jgi:pullulanase/glycogen debranching enzyme
VVPDGRRLRFFIRLAAPKSDELYADRRSLIFIRRGAALPRHARFFQLMIAFRKTHPSIARRTFWRNDVHWYGMDGAPDWGPEARTLAYSLLGASARDDDLYVMINAGSADQTFTIEEGTAADWLRVVDTSRPSPDDIVAPGSERALTHPQYQVMARSVVVLRRPQDTSHASARPAAGEQNR